MNLNGGTMEKIDKIGNLPSKVWCPDCNMGKEIKAIETFGFPTSRVVETLEWVATHHENLHPRHNPHVIIYRANLH